VSVGPIVAEVARTYWGDERWTSREAWRAIRQLRSNPPPAVTPDRRPLFAAALEQSEQLFGSAAVAGPATRPLTVFYGLSQAGRAIAAARDSSDGHPLRGHGVTANDLNDTNDAAGQFPRLKVRRQGGASTSFVRLSTILGSPLFPDGIELRDLWAMLPEAHLHEPLTHHPHPVLLSEYPGRSEQPAFSSAPADLTVEGFPGWAQHYPDLGDAQLIPQSLEQSGRFTFFRVQLPASPEGDWGTNYRGTLVHLPAPPGHQTVMHPTLIWWAILLAMSTLARYSPTAWASIIDIDSSPYATPIEYLLDESLAAVPDLIYRALIDEHI